MTIVIFLQNTSALLDDLSNVLGTGTHYLPKGINFNHGGHLIWLKNDLSRTELAKYILNINANSTSKLVELDFDDSDHILKFEYNSHEKYFKFNRYGRLRIINFQREALHNHSNIIEVEKIKEELKSYVHYFDTSIRNSNLTSAIKNTILNKVKIDDILKLLPEYAIIFSEYGGGEDSNRDNFIHENHYIEIPSANHSSSYQINGNELRCYGFNQQDANSFPEFTENFLSDIRNSFLFNVFLDINDITLATSTTNPTIPSVTAAQIQQQIANALQNFTNNTSLATMFSNLDNLFVKIIDFQGFELTLNYTLSNKAEKSFVTLLDLEVKQIQANLANQLINAQKLKDIENILKDNSTGQMITTINNYVKTVALTPLLNLKLDKKYFEDEFHKKEFIPVRDLATDNKKRLDALPNFSLLPPIPDIKLLVDSLTIKRLGTTLLNAYTKDETYDRGYINTTFATIASVQLINNTLNDVLRKAELKVTGIIDIDGSGNITRKVYLKTETYDATYIEATFAKITSILTTAQINTIVNTAITTILNGKNYLDQSHFNSLNSKIGSNTSRIVTLEGNSANYVLRSELAAYLTKVDAAAIYLTKTDANNTYAKKGDAYTKSESDGKFALKTSIVTINTALYVSKSELSTTQIVTLSGTTITKNVYTIAEADGKFALKTLMITMAQVTAAINGALLNYVDKTEFETLKTQVNTNKSDIADIRTKMLTTASLNTYVTKTYVDNTFIKQGDAYLKGETYSKTEADGKFALKGSGLDNAAVTAIVNTILGTKNYATVTQLGAVDAKAIANAAAIATIQGQLGSIPTTATINTMLAQYMKKTDYATDIAQITTNKNDISGIKTQLLTVATMANVNTLLNDYVKTSVFNPVSAQVTVNKNDIATLKTQVATLSGGPNLSNYLLISAFTPVSNQVTTNTGKITALEGKLAGIATVGDISKTQLQTAGILTSAATPTANVYTKKEIDDKNFATKADLSTVTVDLTAYYKKTEIDAKFAEKSNTYTKTEVDTKISASAVNTTNFATKAQLDSIKLQMTNFGNTEATNITNLLASINSLIS